jgi:Arc/MetJ-type ribon-helix-helix transcriptional regulator
MAHRGTPSRVTVDLPPWVAERLAAEVKQGRYPSVEEAVLAGAKLVAGLGPRARELLREGAGADEFVRADDGRDQGDWL